MTTATILTRIDLLLQIDLMNHDMQNKISKKIVTK